jgi:hypothetical protein
LPLHLYIIIKTTKIKIMKNVTTTCNMFPTAKNSATANSTALTNHANKNQLIKRAVLLFVCTVALLTGTTSCSRDISSGCGTWPTVKVNKNQYRSDSWPVKTKSNSQFANYKHYN